MWTQLDEMDAWCSQLRIQVDTGVASSEFDSSCAPLFIWNLIRPPQWLCTVFTT